MASAQTGREKQVTVECARCGTPFAQAHGFVTVRNCAGCITILAAEFWQAT